MKKNIILLGALIISGVAYSQVGIDTDTPKATLDIKASPTSTTKIDGLIAPRLKGSELKTNDPKYSADQDGAIVYVTEALASANTSIKTANVTSIGYYYFDKTLDSGNGQWVKVANPVAAAVYQEPWNNVSDNQPATSNTADIYQMGNVGVGTNAPDSKLHVAAGNTALRFSNSASDGILQVSSNATNNWARLGTKGSSLAILTDNTEVGGNAPAIYVENTKNVGVGTSSPTQVLDVNGATRLRGQIYDNTNTSGTSGQILSTNTSGQVVWQSNAATQSAVFGVMNSNAPSYKVSNANYNTGSYIDLPKGKWIVNLTVLLTMSTTDTNPTNPSNAFYPNAGDSYWVKTGLSTSDVSYNQANYLTSAKYVSGSLIGPSAYGLISGLVLINNNSGSTQRYYLWRLEVDTYGTATKDPYLAEFGGTRWGENQIFAQPIN